MSKWRSWTEGEDAYLEENWGRKSIPVLAKHLQRPISGVIDRRYRLNLGRHDSGDPEYVTFNMLCTLLGHYEAHLGAKPNWIKIGFPIIQRKTVSRVQSMVKISDFWKWAAKNKWRLNLSEYEDGALRGQPGWVAEKRRADQEFETKFPQQTKWTKQDEAMLLSLTNQGLGYREISLRIHRSEGAIKRRLLHLGVKIRPVRQPAHSPHWDPSSVMVVKFLCFFGYQKELIAEYVGRSAQAVNGIEERLAAKGMLELTEEELHDYRNLLPDTLWPRVERYLRLENKNWMKQVDTVECVAPVVEAGAILL